MYFKVRTLFIVFLGYSTTQIVSGNGTVVLRPTVCSQPANIFDMWKDVETIHKILDHIHCLQAFGHPNELRWTVTQRNTTQRVMIREAYDIKYSDKKLLSTLKSKLTGHCESIIRRSFLTHEEIRGIELINSFETGYTLSTVADILCTLTKDQYAALDKYIISRLNKTLFDYMSEQNPSKNVVAKRVVNYCLLQFSGLPQWTENNKWCKQNFDMTITTFNRKDLDKQSLEDTLSLVLNSCSKEELAEIIQKSELREKIQILDIRCSGQWDKKRLYETIVNSTANMFEYMAYAYRNAITNNYVDHSFIIRNTIIHSNIDLQNIKDAYATIFNGEKIIDYLLKTDEVKGHACYRQTLKEYLKEPDPAIQPCLAEADPLLTIPEVTPPAKGN